MHKLLDCVIILFCNSVCKVGVFLNIAQYRIHRVYGILNSVKQQQQKTNPAKAQTNEQTKKPTHCKDCS